MKTRESKKAAYCSNFMEVFKKEMANTIWTEQGQEMWIEEYAYTHYLKRRNDIESKADALMFGIIDANAYVREIKEETNKALN